MKAARSTASPVTGTRSILRLYVRLDRTRIGIWVVAFFTLLYGSVVAMHEAYPTAEALQGRASLMHNPAAVMMTGPAFSLDDYTFGAMLANELVLWTLLPVAIMSILLVVRHTRQDEEAGRTETLRALPLGRHAPTAATLGVVSIANAGICVAVAAALALSGMPFEDSAAFGIGAGLLGLLFGSVAAVTAQLTEHARTASAMAMAVLAVSAIVRGFGDVIAEGGSWLSWFSPIAWVQQTRLFVDLRWWPLTLVVGAIIAMTAVATLVGRRRDLGAGMLPSRIGPDRAESRLLGPLGIAHRLTAGTFVGWTAGLLVFALGFGMLASSLDTFVADNPALSDWVPLSMDDVTTSFAAVIISLLAVGPIILAMSAIVQLTREERETRLDSLIVTGSSRRNTLFAWVIVSTGWAAVSMVVLGVGTGVGLAFVTSNASWVPELTLAAAAYLPAILVSSGLATFLVGLGARYTVVAWAYFAFVTLDVYLGDLLNLPSWIRGLSPLWQTPLAPFDDVHAGPLVAMTLIAVALVGAGYVAFARRDLATA